MHLYTPILQTKQGELNALAELLHLDATKTIPLLQLLPDTKADRAGNYVQDRLRPILKAWNFLDNRVLVDAVFLGEADLPLLIEFLQVMKEGMINVIPVLHPQTSSSFQAAFRPYTLLGACLRASDAYLTVPQINQFIRQTKETFIYRMKKLT